MCISKMSRTFCGLSKKRVLANFFALSILLSPCGALAAPAELDDDQTPPSKDAIEVLYKAALNAYNNGRFSASKQMAVACQTFIEDSGSNRIWLPYAQSLSAKCDFELGNYDDAETEMSADLNELKNFGAPPEILRFYTCDLAAILIHNMKGREALDLLNALSPTQKNSPRVAYLLGLSKAIVLDYSGAEAELRKALTFVTTYGSDEVDVAEIHQHLGFVLTNSGRLKEGIWESTMAINSQDGAAGRHGQGVISLALVDLGIALYRKGDYAHSRAILQKAVDSIHTLQANDPNRRVHKDDAFSALAHPTRSANAIAISGVDTNGSALNRAPLTELILDDRAKRAKTPAGKTGKSNLARASQVYPPSTKDDSTEDPFSEPLEGPTLGTDQKLENDSEMIGSENEPKEYGTISGTARATSTQFELGAISGAAIGTIGQESEVIYSSPPDLSGRRAELAFAVVLAKLGEIEKSYSMLNDLQRISTYSLTQNYGFKLDSPESYRRMLERAELDYKLEPQLLADVFETVGELSLAKSRMSNPFPLPENRAKAENDQNVFELNRIVVEVVESKLSAAITLRLAMKQLGLETDSLDTLSLNSDELLLRSPRLLVDLRSEKSCSDRLALSFLKAWADLHKRRGNPELEFRKLLQNSEFLSNQKYKRQLGHAQVLLAFALSEKGDFEQAANVLKTVVTQALSSDTMTDTGKERLLEFAIYVNFHADRQLEAARLIALLRNIPTTEVTDHMGNIYCLETTVLKRAREPKKAIQVATDGLAWLERDGKKTAEGDNEKITRYKSICNSLHRSRSGAYDFVGDRANSLKDLVSYFERSTTSNATWYSTVNEIICSKRRFKKYRDDYLDENILHGGRPALKNNKFVRVYFDLREAPGEDWKRNIKNIAMASFKDWEKQLGKNNWFFEEKDRSRAELIFTFNLKPGESNRNGNMSWDFAHNSRSKAKTEPFQYTIDLYKTFYDLDLPYYNTSWILPSESRRMSPWERGEARSVIIHEIGHALGLRHSDSETDVMYFCNKVRDLSARDIATIRRLYKVDGHDKHVVATHRLRK
ncbi:MAG: matrixin family metalloprotease [Candidatus Obscuribacterales bacterium]|nr:matrixin family metalloprotease [Candidatus Obscuribacterales bacterium]